MTTPTPLLTSEGRIEQRDVALIAAAALCILVLLFYSVLLVSLTKMLLASGVPKALGERDFANYWLAGRLVVSGEQQQLFHMSTFMQHLRDLFGSGYSGHTWSYPPHYLLFVWPLGLLQFKPALIAFLMVTIALFVGSVVLSRRAFAPDARVGVLWLAGTAYTAIMVLATQNGFLTGAALLFGLVFMKDRPALAGLAFACLTVKPQLGVLIPVLLLFDRNWRAIAWSAGFASVLVGLSIALFGIESWHAYLTDTLSYQYYAATHWTGSFLSMMPTVFGSARAAGHSADLAFSVQWLVSIAATGLVAWLLWKETDPLRRVFTTLCGTFLVTPYALDYDMGALTVMAALLAGTHRCRTDRSSIVFALIAALASIVALLGRFHLPIGPVILASGLIAAAIAAVRAAGRSAAGTAGGDLTPSQVS